MVMSFTIDNVNLQQKEKYNVVSLGFFCGVSLEMERLGIRTCSLPFDWLISDHFPSVIDAIKNNFLGFLEEENLYQEYDINPAYYYNRCCRVHFYHDFSPFKTLFEQYDDFYAKYQRRITRFYEMIQSPTIFIRYCANEDEMEYIFDNQEEIVSLIKRYNPNNEIIYISKIKTELNIKNLFYIREKRGKHNKKFLKELPVLQKKLLFNSIHTGKKRIKIISSMRKVVMRIARLIGVKPYCHSKQFKNMRGIYENEA